MRFRTKKRKRKKVNNKYKALQVKNEKKFRKM